MKEFRSRRLRVWENISRTMQEFKVLLLGYRSYTALLTQTGTDAPVATVLENTLGFDINWIREANGGYPTDNLSFDETKTVVFITPSTDLTDTPTFAIGYSNSGGYNRIIIYTVNDGVYSDDMLKNTPIEIRVYNK